MIFLFFSLLSFLFKWQRFIFILISLEFLVLSLFYFYSGILFSLNFFLFMSFTVISSVMGMVLMVGLVKFYGTDKCLF
uniref:NADH dehydrogenase subunit 4L n=1 Tax=Panagrellus redivivus TaxID=6233 RepID=A0A1E1G797_PANRE|nr:NADH dehydrogenase subunit 4L [Panagrellus redivivus]